MLNPEFLLIGLALATDSAVVSFALGLLGHELGKKDLALRGLSVVLVFGFFQFLMLWLGSFGGYALSFSHYGHLYRPVVGLVFLLIGAKFFHESMSQEKCRPTWKPLTLIVMGVVTSIDALATGVTLGTMPRAYLMAMDIGIITSFLCGTFYVLAQFFKTIPEKWLLRGAGLIFLGIGANTIWKQNF
jgi:putative Mn2+ efflux pump MntP